MEQVQPSMIKAEDIPQDVIWVWTIQGAGITIGLETLEEMEAIIKANPKYFPWETKYHSIPKEVHDAYFKEKNHIWDVLFKEKLDGGYKGMIPTILEMSEREAPEPDSMPQKSLTEIMADLFKMQEDKRKREEEEHKKNKALWDKHYKLYGLEYRK